jgi:hypothetical protein
VIYLDPTKIAFTNGAKIATHDADGYTAIDGSSNFAYYRADVANLVTSSNEGSFRANGLTISQTSGNYQTNVSSAQVLVSGGSAEGKLYAGGLYIESGGKYVQITPPGDDAFFQSVTVCVNGEQKTAKVLMTTPI